MTRFTRLAVGAVSALALAPAAAFAAPVAPCAGVLQTDSATDVVKEEDGAIAGSQTGQANEEIEAFFLNTKAGVVTANIQIANLDKKLPTGFTAGNGGIYYYAYWTFEDETHFVRAANGNGTITYGHGRVIDGAYVTDGTTTGDFQEGPHGTVSMVIPADIGGKVGQTLGKIFGTAETIEGRDDFAGFNHVMDASIPEHDVSTPNGKDYVVTECPAGGSTPPPAGGGSTPPPSGGGSTPPPSGGGSTPPPSSGSGSTPPLTASLGGIPSKAKVAAAKGIKAKVKCSAACKGGVVATLDAQTAKRLKLGKKAVKIGIASFTRSASGESIVTLKLTAKAKKALKRAKRIQVLLSANVTDANGGQARTLNAKTKLS